LSLDTFELIFKFKILLFDEVVEKFSVLSTQGEFFHRGWKKKGGVIVASGVREKGFSKPNALEIYPGFRSG
jgi:hypothetical protein